MIFSSRDQRKNDVIEVVTREWYSIKEVAHLMGVVPATVSD